MIKILHTADIHLDSPLQSLALKDVDLQTSVQVATRKALLKIVDLAIEENVAALLLAGDLFDSAQRSAQTSAFLLTQLQKLDKHEIPVCYIKGNHDADNPLINTFEWPQNVKVFSARGETYCLPAKLADGRAVYVHGMSFEKKYAPNLLDKFPAPKPDAYNIGLLHTSLGGSLEHDPYAPSSIRDLSEIGYDYWALGHIHKRDTHQINNSFIVMPGIPQGRDMGETGQKSATLLTIPDQGLATIEEKITSELIFAQEELQINFIEDKSDLQQFLMDRISEISAKYKDFQLVLRLTLKGATTLNWQLIRDYDSWLKLIDELTKNTGHIWLEKLELKTEDVPKQQNNGTSDTLALPIYELQKTMNSLMEDEQFIKACRKDIEALSKLLPVEIKNRIANSKEEQLLWEKNWCDQALKQGNNTINSFLASNSQEQGEE